MMRSSQLRYSGGGGSRSDFYAYRPKFLRHLHNLTINGFYTRELDADDHAFIEYVKTKGIANGTLPNAGAVLSEELDFWEYPYEIQPDISRKHGPPAPKEKETEEQRELRKLRSKRWRAWRAIRVHDKAVAAAELERERKEWAQAEAERLRRRLQSDIEWELADPDRPRLAKGKRHYVPQWKQTEADKIDQAKREAEFIEAEKREHQRLEVTNAEYAKYVKRERLAEDARRREAVRRDQLRKNANSSEARIAELERQAAEMQRTDKNAIKQQVISMMHRTAPYIWASDRMAQAIGCKHEMMIAVLHELAREGRLRIRSEPQAT